MMSTEGICEDGLETKRILDFEFLPGGEDAEWEVDDDDDKQTAQRDPAIINIIIHITNSEYFYSLLQLSGDK